MRVLSRVLFTDIRIIAKTMSMVERGEIFALLDDPDYDFLASVGLGAESLGGF